MSERAGNREFLLARSLPRHVATGLCALGAIAEIVLGTPSLLSGTPLAPLTASPLVLQSSPLITAFFVGAALHLLRDRIRFGFPLQQLVVFVTGTREPWIVLAIVIGPTVAIAALSWRFVEKPALRFGRGIASRIASRSGS